MKNILQIVAISSVAAFCAFQTKAYDFKSGQLCYNILEEGKTVEVASNGTGSEYSGDIEIPAVVTNGNVTYNVVGVGDSAFAEWHKLKKVVIPESVGTIGNNAFSYCLNLNSVNIPGNVTAIGEYAFRNCLLLTEVTLPATLNSIPQYAFYKTGLVSIDIPSPVATIGDNAFAECTSLAFVKLPASVTNIGDHVFSHCNSLESITVGEGNPIYASSGGILYSKDMKKLVQCPAGKKGTVEVPESVEEIGPGSFGGCSGLTSVILPASVTKIGDSAFESCSSLNSLSLPDGINTIGESAFRGCSGLTDIVIPPLVTAIETMTFLGCEKLETVQFPESLTSIGASAFYSCTGLKTVQLPATVTSIGANAFFYCPNIGEFYVEATNPPAYQDPGFSQQVFDTATLYVPKGSKEKYESAAPWSSFKNIQEQIDTGIGDMPADDVVQTICINGRNLAVEGSGENLTVVIYDMAGRKIHEAEAGTDVSLPKGIYVVRVGEKAIKIEI